MKRNSVFLLCSCFMFCVLHGNAQQYILDGDYSSEDKYVKEGIVNSCLDYYNSPDKNALKFKSVTINHYSSSDTVFKDKFISTREMVSFNKMGQITFDVDYDRYYNWGDSVGVKDSTRFIYDAAYNKIREIHYLKEEDSDKVYKISDEFWTYNKKAYPIKDSVYKISPNYRREVTTEELKHPSITTYYYKFDTAGNELEKIEVDGNDSIPEEWKYDTKNREIYYSRYNGDYRYDKKYLVYDAAGNEISETTTEPYDTIALTWTYDNKERIINYRKTEHGKVIEASSTGYDNDGGRTETLDETPMGDGFSCPNDSRTVTVYNKNSVILSEVVTKEKNGKNFIHTTRHKYLFKGEHIALDSAVTIDRGYLYYLALTEVKTNKFDARDNLIEETNEGGGEYSYSGSERWKYNEKNNILEDNTYNSCNTDKPEKSTIYTYYPDGKTVKELIEDNAAESYSGKTITEYSKDSRKKEIRNIYKGYSYLTVFTYEK
ncbi:MAG TPA: hypothetical protein VNY36_07960 [Bacteroidia bacterium]|jgi:hypothetical protein|nr:hypothetical protein [Bacteroidia bacterium]